MAKLTKAQRGVLVHMADGDEIWTLSPPKAWSYWRNNRLRRSPGFPTIIVLHRLGYIEPYERDITGSKYRITPAGRLALKEQNNG